MEVTRTHTSRGVTETQIDGSERDALVDCSEEAANTKRSLSVLEEGVRYDVGNLCIIIHY